MRSQPHLFLGLGIFAIILFFGSTSCAETVDTKEDVPLPFDVSPQASPFKSERGDNETLIFMRSDSQAQRRPDDRGSNLTMAVYSTQESRSPALRGRNLQQSIPFVLPVRPCSTSKKCQRCEGHCENNGECQSGLICHDKGGVRGSPIPGCQGTDNSKTRWCIAEGTAPTPPSPSPRSSSPIPFVTPVRPCSGSNKCQRCEGHCENDGECQAGLVCHDKGGVRGSPIPGCIGTDNSKTRWCIEQGIAIGPTPPPPPPSSSPIPFVTPVRPCSGSNQCRRCEGHCENDGECQSGLVCHDKGGVGGSPIPGCIGTDNSKTRWCILSSSSPPPPSGVSYEPGNFSRNRRSSDGKVKLSNGLSATVIAAKNQQVPLNGGGRSGDRFHIDPDGAAVVNGPNGGWYYVSNAEEPAVGSAWNNGGVGSIQFDSSGRVIGYKRVASGTRNNCGGGRTPWNSWVSCEEVDNGKIFQTDPRGSRDKRATAMGSMGWYESFAYDDKVYPPRFFVTRDAERGFLTRFTPNSQGLACYNKQNDYDRWCTLDHGTLDYLLISGGPSGTFTWTTNRGAAEQNARQYYWFNEGIDVANGRLYFTSKKLKRMVILNLRAKTYTYHSTVSGAFNHQPDQVSRLLKDDHNSVLYFCEDGGNDPGVHGRDKNGKYFTILFGQFPYGEETTGLAWSRDSKHMYVSFQNTGKIYDVTRDDGLPFSGQTLDIKYH